MKLHIVIFFLFSSLSESYPHTTDYYRQTSYTAGYPVYVGTTDGTRRSGSSSGHGGAVGPSHGGRKTTRDDIWREIKFEEDHGKSRMKWDYNLEEEANRIPCHGIPAPPLRESLLSPSNDYKPEQSIIDEINSGKLTMVGCSNRPDCVTDGVLCLFKFGSRSRSHSGSHGSNHDDLFGNSPGSPESPGSLGSPTTVASFSSSTRHFISALLFILSLIFV